MSTIKTFHAKVKLDGTIAPTATDDSSLGYNVSSRWIDITNDKEYVCVDSTASAAVWIETTGAGSGSIHTDCYTWYDSSAKPYADTTSVSYTTIDRIIFPGTSFDTPSSIKIITNVETGYTGSVRIYDLTNSLTIAEVSFTNIIFEIVDLGTLSNLSSAQAIWEVQLKTSSINREVQASSMRINY